ncbi:MAG: Maf family protein [Clostridia bacterium]|nr:Maf family protein [Clostridia bacterium]
MKIERIILASSSPRRREILSRFGIKFDVIPSDADENITAPDCRTLVCELAKLKGDSVYDALRQKGDDMSRTLLISCDTVVEYNGMVIGKPADARHAELTLGLLSDSWHNVLSGLQLRVGDTAVADCALTRVKFAPVPEDVISAYVATGEPMGKAGSYAIQGLAGSFVERIEGDYFNIVGLPLALMVRMLRDDFGLSMFDLESFTDAVC